MVQKVKIGFVLVVGVDGFDFTIGVEEGRTSQAAGDDNGVSVVAKKFVERDLLFVGVDDFNRVGKRRSDFNRVAKSNVAWAIGHISRIHVAFGSAFCLGNALCTLTSH